MLHMQDSCNDLYDPESHSDRGTLANIKTVFGFKGVRSKVTQAFGHNEDMLYATTKSLICLTAMELLDFESVDSSLPDDCDAADVLDTVASQVTSFFWRQTSMTNIMEIVEARTPELIKNHPEWIENGYGCPCGHLEGNYFIHRLLI